MYRLTGSYVYVLRIVHVSKQLTTCEQQKHTLFLRYLYYSITLSIPTYSHHQGTSNIAQQLIRYFFFT